MSELHMLLFESTSQWERRHRISSKKEPNGSVTYWLKDKIDNTEQCWGD